MLIVIDGCDGSGKTTVVEAVAKEIGAQIQRFPDDAAFTGPMIRSYLRREWVIADRLGETLGGGPATDAVAGALAFQALQIANRMERMPKLIAAKSGEFDLILDRYCASAWVYGQLDGLPVEFLERIHEAMVQPDFNVLLHAIPETCLERRALRDGAKPPERYEGDLARTKKIAEMYQKLWTRKMASRDGQRWNVVDAERSMNEVVEQCLRLMR